MAKKKNSRQPKNSTNAKGSDGASKESPGKKPTVSKKVRSQPPSHASTGDSSASPSGTAAPETKCTTTELRPEFLIAGIGASAGGLEALEAFFKAMPSDPGIACVVVVHLDPTHNSMLAELLQRRTKMPVCQIEDGMRVERDHVYVIPPDADLEIRHGKLHVVAVDRSQRVRQPIDSFFRTLADDQQHNAVGIVLSGTGTDGTLGVNAIKGGVGMVMVQDEESAMYEGMPQSAIATGLVDYVLPPDKMPEQLLAYARHANQKLVSKHVSSARAHCESLEKIFMILRTRTEHDFSSYKENTIRRRIERRMNVHRIDNFEDYVRYVQESEREVGILFKELLIGVTNFFRDPQAFEALQTKVLPKLLADKPEDWTVRVWVPGCASGEEAYSVAILLHEWMDKARQRFNVQVFGTDINEDAISVARAGCYPDSIALDVGPERIDRYFTKESDGQYRVKKLIREMLIFASQNVIKDPPFSKLDLLCCRNLLIYFDAELQRRLLLIFHQCLNPGGILFLGISETIGHGTDIFAAAQRKWKIFRRRPSIASASRAANFPVQPLSTQAHSLPMSEGPPRRADMWSDLKLVEAILQQANTPPCVIIDDASNILYIHGRVGKFLEPAEGRASLNILEMARSGLKTELATAISQVAADGQEITCQNLQVESDRAKLVFDLSVTPVWDQTALHGLIMVAFNETEAPGAPRTPNAQPQTVRRRRNTVAELEHDLLCTKNNLNATIRELRTTNEELKSATEELQSNNEELQSANEELETSKEELQSLNEESVTVNAELQARADELNRTNDDLKNLLDSTEIAVIFLDMDLQVRRFTTKATEIIPLTVADLGRPINHLASALIDVELADYGRQVLQDLVVREFEAESQDNRHYLVRVRSYRTEANVIEGIVITFQEFTQLKQSYAVAEQTLTFAESILATVRDPMVVLDSDLRVVSANKSFYRVFGVLPIETEGQLVYELGSGQWDIPALTLLLEDVLPEQSVFEDFRVEHEFETLGRKTMLLNARRLEQNAVGKDMILLAFEDVTGRADQEPGQREL